MNIALFQKGFPRIVFALAVTVFSLTNKPEAEAQTPIVIDTFRLPNSALDVRDHTPDASSVTGFQNPNNGSGQIIGGRRDYSATLSANATNTAPDSYISAGLSGSGGNRLAYFDHNIAMTGTGGQSTAVISWGQAADLNRDFTTLGSIIVFNLSIQNQVVSHDTTLQLSLTSGTTTLTSAKTVSGSVSSGTISWTNADFPSFNFADVDRIALQWIVDIPALNTQTSRVELVDFQAIPEPSNGVFAAFGIATLGLLRARRRPLA
jgi:hypothetical protein